MIIVEIAGYLGSDPETRVTAQGQKVTSFRVATNVRKGGKDETVWWRVTIWGDHRLIPYLKKGSAVLVIGEMNPPQIYTDKEGNPQVSMELKAEIVRFSPFGKPGSSGAGENQQMQTSEYQGFSNQPKGKAPEDFYGQPAKNQFAPHGQAQYGQGSDDSDFSDDEPLPF